MTRFDRYTIDGLHGPMQPRTRAIPWQQLVQAIAYTLCGIALIAGLLWIGAPK